MAIIGVVALLAAGGVAVYKYVLTGTRSTSSSSGAGGTNTSARAPGAATPAPTSGQTTQSAAPAGSAEVLPFTGLDRPVDVTVGIGGMSAGAVYVTDSGNNRVVRLAAHSSTQTVPAFTGLHSPQGLAVDDNGDVYVTDGNDNRMLWARIPGSPPSPPWQASSSAEWVGPFSGLQSPHGALIYHVGGVLVAGAGSYFVADSGTNRVLKWTVGTNAVEVIPFSGLNNPNGVAMVNTVPDVIYVVDSGNNRVVKQAVGSSNPQTVLPFTGLNNPHGVVLDDSGDVYVTDSGNNRVVKLAADRNNPTGLAANQRAFCRSAASTIRKVWRRTARTTSTSSTAATTEY